MKKKEREERRAANMIWNGAQDYTIQPKYEAFDEQGNADLYFNYVIGTVYRYFEFDKIERMMRYLEPKQNGDLYMELFWIGLEHAAFGRAYKERPVMQELRQNYAKEFLQRKQPLGANPFFWELKTGICTRILGKEYTWNKNQKRIADALCFPSDCSTEELVDRMDNILRKYFFKSTFTAHDDLGGHISEKMFLFPFHKLGRKSTVRRISWSDDQYREGTNSTKSKLQQFFDFAQRSDTATRAYVENCFGQTILSQKQQQELEETLCTDIHKDCIIHITNGIFKPNQQETKQIQQQREFVQQKRAENRAYFQKNYAQTQMAISRLTEKIRNVILTQLENSDLCTRSGMLQSGKLWRTVYLQDLNVFHKTISGQMEEFLVDILIDGSASQREQQSSLATQAYIIAESLTRCQVPVRVCSFCSVGNCTVLQILREYEQKQSNDTIFDFVASGWNRDGLAVRILGAEMAKQQKPHILIILSDASPNDEKNVSNGSIFGIRKEYHGAVGIEDMAQEINKLRQNGVWVMCVFTGNDQNLPAAQRIYGRNIVRIRSIGWFADAVGRLLQERIQEM